jgi:urea carboxylase
MWGRPYFILFMRGRLCQHSIPLIMFRKILIANRGAIAVRIIRTLKKMNIISVVIFSDADKSSLHVQLADVAIALDGNLASETYLNSEKILRIASENNVQAIHPGYGFLSENAAFARCCAQENIVFIGPTPEQLEQFGLKHTARDLAKANGVPLISGSDLLSDLDEALTIANDIGYPIMLKSTAGGGGIGMKICQDIDTLKDAFASVKRLSQNNFGNDGVFIEKYINRSRHIEVQVVGDGKGYVTTLGERDCSLQRRNQKVIEETPAPNLPIKIRDQMIAAAKKLAESVNYQSAGTVEFIYDVDLCAFYFLEVNTRLQVEHGVTEMVTGVDLVEWMIKIAANAAHVLLTYKHQPKGHAIQARIYAEDPYKNFQPSSGLLTHVALPGDCRCDTHIKSGITVSSYYDPMLAKIIAYDTNRELAIKKLIGALGNTSIEGIVSNIHYLQEVLLNNTVKECLFTTNFLDTFDYQSVGVDVLKAGTQTTIQDYPGRTGLWNVGVPPSGPMDNLAFQIGNQLLGNNSVASGLEITLTGPTLKFRCDSVIALTGALMNATIDGEAVDFWQATNIKAGSILQLDKLTHAGMRSYLCVAGGFQLTDYLGSKSTFTLGQFGGHSGRALLEGDVLPILQLQATELENTKQPTLKLAAADQPSYSSYWKISVIYGPHGAPDFFTEEDIKIFFETQWQVHFNSSRTGVRLSGPKPQWARKDGGEAGLHPSNIHDNAYAIGAVDFTGDMPVILGPDGPSLGGFVCPVTLVKADLWKLGQLKPGDTIRFIPISAHEAEQQEKAQHYFIENLSHKYSAQPNNTVVAIPTNKLSAILHRQDGSSNSPRIIYRISGDDNILIEYGELELDLSLRFRVHALMLWLEQEQQTNPLLKHIIDITPGIRSLQIHFNNLYLSRDLLLKILIDAEQKLGDISTMTVPTRTIYLPLSWDDPSTQVAIEKYMTTVNPDAPWCPSNIEFIRRINGLNSLDDVKDIVLSANYLVMGLGDVYLGAPVATPLDPRHRLVTTKYNPARTWTPENAVGIGGAYMCIYGMEGPGGYQFVGRTLQVWNRYNQTNDFTQPWLLRFFDQIRFYEVSHDELQQIRSDFPLGRFSLRIEESEFSLAEYEKFLAENSSDIADFRKIQRQAFSQERDRWEAAGLNFDAVEVDKLPEHDEIVLADTEEAVFSHIPGSLWKLDIEIGQRINAGDTLAIIESMKMEFPIRSDVGGIVTSIFVKEGQQLNTGQMLIVISTAQ